MASDTLESAEPLQTPYKLRRHWLTGEWEELPCEGSGVIRVIEPPGGTIPRCCNPWDASKDHTDRGMSIMPELATPERIAAENAEARQHGTGAVYDKRGVCHLPTRGSKNRELRRRRLQNNDAGYGDHAGR